MAPEVLNSQTFPASDIWSAGVMAYQLLSGYLPFDDVRNPNAPALSIIWKGILTEEPSFRRSAWTEVSPEAKDFVTLLLNKNHEKRPTAKEALKHPWLQTSFHLGTSRPLNTTVVQRIQRFAQTNVLRRTILELMANELLKMAPPRLSDPSMQGGSAFGGGGSGGTASGPIPIPAGTSPGDGGESDGGAAGTSGDNSASGDNSIPGGAVFPMSPEQPGSGSLGTSMDAENSFGAPGSNGLRPTLSGGFPRFNSGDLSAHGGRAFPRSPSVQQLATLARAAGRRGAATVHGPGDYWRIMRQASELAAMGSGHGQMSYLRAVPRSEEERQEQRKAARLSLDTSAHAGAKYAEMMAKFESSGNFGGGILRRKTTGGMRMSASVGSLRHPDLVGSAPATSGTTELILGDVLEKKKEEKEKVVIPKEASGSGPLFPLVGNPAIGTFHNGGAAATLAAAGTTASAAVPMEQTDVMEGRSRGKSLAFMALQAGGGSSDATSTDPVPMEVEAQPSTTSAIVAPSTGTEAVRTVKRVTFGTSSTSAEENHRPAPAPFGMEAGAGAPLSTTIPAATAKISTTPFQIDGGTLERAEVSVSAPLSSASHSGPITNPQDLEGLMRKLNFRRGASLSRDALADGLKQLGYDLAPSEISVLVDQLDLDADSVVDPAEFIASQMDWGAMQRSNRDLWLECARRAFADLDINSDGKLSSQDLVASLRAKLPADEVDFAVEDALLDAGAIDADDIDFEGFLRMLHVGSFESLDSLDQYDDRLRRTSIENMDSSLHGGVLNRLETVPEDRAQK